MKSFVKILAAAIGVAGLVGNASAVPTLYLTDGTASVTVADGSALDSNPAAGVVTYNGAIGINWTVNVSTGASKPDLGSATQPWMSLASFNATSKGAGSVTIKFSDDNFGPAAGNLLFTTGGSTVGTVGIKAYSDASNALFGQGTLLDSYAYAGSPLHGAFSSMQSKNFAGALPFSLTEVATITHTTKGFSSFSEQIRVPDAGVTVALLGSSLIGLAIFGRSRKTV